MSQPDITPGSLDFRQLPFVALVFSTLLCLGISLYFLQMGISIVFQNLYYFPILIACTFYQKRGFVFSVLLSLIYFSLIILFYQDFDVVFQALVRVFIFIIIASVITILSQMNKESRERLQEKESLFRGIFDTMPSGAAIYEVTGDGKEDVDYKIKDINSTALKYENKQKSDVIGRTLDDIGTVIHTPDLVSRLREVHKGTEPVLYQAEVKTPDGRMRYYDTSLFRLPSHEVVSISTDVTDKKLMEEELKASEETFRLAMNATSDGLWDWNMKTGEVYYSPAFAKILEEEHIKPVFDSWEKRIHPEDRERVLSSLHEHISGSTSRWRVETRLRTSNGSWKWVMDRGSVVSWDESGTPTRMIGSIVDISEQKRIEEVIRIERDRAEQYLNIAEVMIIVLSRDGTIVLINRKGAEMLGASVDDIIGLNWFDTFIPVEMIESTKEVFQNIIHSTGEMYFSNENEIITRENKIITVSWVNTLIRTPEGQTLGTLSSGEDLTNKKKLEEEKNQLLDQIQRNLAQMAFLNDNIRNPLSIIISLADIYLTEDKSQVVQKQVDKISDSITKLDQRWSESEKVLNYIRKYYQISPK
ncbi:PAS domain S-box protein [Methanospirillum lacunae]|uniref:histidine kinase n=1 Tax=Methanospirillum lacunae TaxID=668570 RepID=A0A2V2N5U3_9EURY|nr:PAS domain S-box protein [Methanospirillum lacunae]PWR70881.1 hypothetical protein DK846_12885 [Methanospirillum lacunae]